MFSQDVTSDNVKGLSSVDKNKVKKCENIPYLWGRHDRLEVLSNVSANISIKTFLQFFVVTSCLLVK